MQDSERTVPVPETHTPRSHIVNQSRHARKCRICNHPDRAAIEFDFINWRNPAELVKSFELRDLSTIYRHAHATGLFARRRLNLRGLMERIAERVSEVPITAAAIIRAARAIAHINDAGEWIDPPTRIIVTHIHEESRSGSRSGRSAQRPGTRVEVRTKFAPIFTSENLDEPSPEAASCGERPKTTDGPKTIVLDLDPQLQKLRIQRWEAIEADRKAKEAKNAAYVEQVHKELAAKSGQRSGPPASNSDSASPVAARTGDATDLVSNRQNSIVPSTSLPEAAVPNSASAALSVHEPRAAEHGSPSSALIARAGSAGSTNPPFPFDPSPKLHRKGRRRHF
jgi:hypothetical protein